MRRGSCARTGLGGQRATEQRKQGWAISQLPLEDGEIPICSVMENGNVIYLVPYKDVPIRNGTENGEIPIRLSFFPYLPRLCSQGSLGMVSSVLWE